MDEEQKEKLIKFAKKRWWVIVLGVVCIIALLSPKAPKPPRDYMNEATNLIQKIDNSETEEDLSENLDEAEKLYADMKKEIDQKDELLDGVKDLIKRRIDNRDSIFSANAVRFQLNKLFSPYDGSCIVVNSVIKNQMNNPSSFEHVDCRYEVLKNNNLRVQETCRGTNAYGGIITVTYEAILTLEGNILSLTELN